MALPKEVFDISSLTEYQLGCVEYVLNSPAYIEVFEPYLKGVRNGFQQAMLDRSDERKARAPDDFLAGGVVVVDGLLEFFKKIIEETNQERVLASAEAQWRQPTPSPASPDLSLPITQGKWTIYDVPAGESRTWSREEEL